jgi:hypothetical protein
MTNRTARPTRKALCLLFGAILLATALPGSAREAVGPALTPKLKGLLVKEMQSVLQASQEIFAALVQGKHDIIANKAQGIHDSFILKQSLTSQDVKDLHRAVPEGFVQTDREFHRTASRLAQAAKAKDSAREQYYFDKMLSGCLTCHTRYAADRFPELGTGD